jgi:hypothetical protein
MSKNSETGGDVVTQDLLRSILILQLGLAKVPQNDIRKVVGCGMARVTEILKHLPKAKR